MLLQDRWVNSAGVRLHCLEQPASTGILRVSFLIVPGTFGFAEDYADEMAALAPRRCIAVSLRGRGRSDIPRHGYRFEDHVADIAAAVDQLGLRSFVLMGYSMGGAYALGYALQAADRFQGLIIGDYQARYRALSPKWIDRALTSLPGRATREVATALQRESSEVSMWDRLGAIQCPVMVVRGGQRGSLVTSEVASMYLQHLPRVDIVTLVDSGHEIWRPDFRAYIDLIGDFLDRADASKPAMN
jgi:pimeloyl-ACP methyl ester carboxylesterase